MPNKSTSVLKKTRKDHSQEILIDNSCSKCKLAYVVNAHSDLSRWPFSQAALCVDDQPVRMSPSLALMPGPPVDQKREQHMSSHEMETEMEALRGGEKKWKKIRCKQFGQV